MTPDDQDRHRLREEEALVRKRQKARALVVALLLGALVILIFAISIAKIQLGMVH